MGRNSACGGSRAPKGPARTLFGRRNPERPARSHPRRAGIPLPELHLRAGGPTELLEPPARQGFGFGQVPSPRPAVSPCRDRAGAAALATKRPARRTGKTDGRSDHEAPAGVIPCPGSNPANVAAGFPSISEGARRDLELVGEDRKAEEGLGSADRNNKATLPLTPPVRTTKSSAKDLSPRAVKLQSTGSTPGLPPGDGRRSAQVRGQRPIRIRLRRAGEDHPFLAWILT